MGRGRKGTGVDSKNGYIRVRFTHPELGRCSEVVDRPDTPANVRWAERVVAEINDRIRRGTFKYADFFPDSRRAQRPLVAAAPTLRELGAAWLDIKGRLASATKYQYQLALEFWYQTLGGDREITSFKPSELERAVGKHPWKSAKLCNNYLIPLRGAFGLATRDKHLLDDPMEEIENTALQRPLPDPFALDEVDLILADIEAHHDPQIYNYFEAAFCTGMRPEEQVALLWTDIDWRNAVARIQRARSFRGELKDVKNYAARDIAFDPRAMAALQRQKEFTFLKTHGFVFENPVTREPWHGPFTSRQRDLYWRPVLKRLGLRYRKPSSTRHTFATAMIMDGRNPSWLAKQMGNSPAMIWKHYTTWIDRASKQQDARPSPFGCAKVKQFGPDLVPHRVITGRRDWTRTKKLS